jgi:hypothetical protein
MVKKKCKKDLTPPALLEMDGFLVNMTESRLFYLGDAAISSFTMTFRLGLLSLL